jgi:translocation and assembly module TamB
MRAGTRILIVACWMFSGPAIAQDADKDYLTAFLEDNLSDAGRDVVITGFSGALSSQATIQQMTIADTQGVWITLNGVTLDWSRSALFSGRVEIGALTADEIIMDRLPESDASALPDPEAPGFSLPELPVSVQIDKLAATRISLGPEILGTAVEGQLDAALRLADGQGSARLSLVRTDDGPAGEIKLDASYANAGNQLVLDLAVTEAEGGIASGILGLPGRPSIDLTVLGRGPTDDFTSDIALRTDGVNRLTGNVSLRGTANGSTGFSANFAGNFAPLLVPDYAAFFGENLELSVSGRRESSGALALDDLTLTTAALRLSGQLSLDAEGQPQAFNLSGNVGLADGAPLVLPLPGLVKTDIRTGQINLSFDGAVRPDWQLNTQITGLHRDDITIGRLQLQGSGLITDNQTGLRFSSDLTFVAEDALPADPAVSRALGTSVSGEIVADYQAADGFVKVARLAVNGQDYALVASGRIDGLQDALNLTGTAEANVADLSRLSDLAGRAMRGAARITLAGSGSPLAGTFNVDAMLNTDALAMGQPELDRLLAGTAQLDISAKRDGGGTTLRRLNLDTRSLSLRGSGQLASDQSVLDATLDFADLSDLGGPYRGALSLTAQFTGQVSGANQDGRLTLTGEGSGLASGQAEADRLLSGRTTVAAEVAITDGTASLTSARLGNPQVTATVTGRTGASARGYDLDARLANLATILPEFPGPLTVVGTAIDGDSAYQVDLEGTGPGQIDARVTGRLGKDGTGSDLRLVGTGQAALANAFIQPRAVNGPVQFDLRLAGPLRMSSLSGQLTMQNARFSDVESGISLRDVGMTARLADGRATLTGRGALTTGGSVSAEGTVGLGAPYAADLAITLARATLRNPELFEAQTSGALRFVGPMLGGAVLSGRLDISGAEIRIPSSGLTSYQEIPDITHVRDKTAVQATRRKAGLFGQGSAAGTNGQTGGSNGGRPFGLDLDLVATNSLFIRGRGLDAELTGRLRLGGTTANTIPSGQFSLIRGRLDILGKRLTLSEATLQLQGDFVPYVSIAASNQSDGITSTVRIDGPAIDPVVSFTSSPDLPQEEVLAHLLFGRGLQNLSALQAAQLANAVASLAGRGGEGIVGRLRKSFGLDDLDVTTDATGSTVLKAGKYISDNVYSEVELGQDGKSQINLNLDLRPGVTVTGRLGADGNTGLGIFVEKDY